MKLVFHYDHPLAHGLARFNPDLMGITLGRHVFFRLPEDLVPDYMRVHERVHARQWRRYGFVGFIVRYVWFVVRYGYERHPLEVEARRAELVVRKQRAGLSARRAG